MKKKFALLAGMLIFSVVLFTACGMPGYVSNPPENIKELKTKLTDDGYQIQELGSALGISDMKTVMAIKSNIDLSAVEQKLSAGEIDLRSEFNMEMILVRYFTEKNDAKEFYEEGKQSLKNDDYKELVKKAEKSDVKIEAKISGKKLTVSMYVTFSGQLKDYITFGAGLSDIFG